MNISNGVLHPIWEMQNMLSLKGMSYFISNHILNSGQKKNVTNEEHIRKASVPSTNGVIPYKIFKQVR